MTPLDRAHAAMTAAPENDAMRLAFYERLADAELFVLLAREAEGDAAEPRIFPTGGAEVVLAFDREERLADFAGGAAPYLGLSGRMLAAMLAEPGLGLGVNFGAPSEILMPPEALAWLAETLSEAPAEIEAQPVRFDPPAGVPEPLLRSLDAKLALTQGRAGHAWLAGVAYADGTESHLLAFVDPAPGAEGALARAAGEALTFAGLEAGWLDVAFFRRNDPAVARLARAGLRFDLPEAPEAAAPAAPGTDPARPPKLT